MRLIDADVLMEHINRKKSEVAKARYTDGFNDAIMRVRSMVHSAPTVDAVEVVHGRWIWVKDHWECSICRGNRFTHDIMLGLDAAYCSRCGAKMDEVDT